MGLRHIPRMLLVALIAVVAALPASALAAPPEQEHFHFLNVDEDIEVCGINVDIVNEGVFTGRAFFDKQGNFVRFLGVASGTTTFTAENGKSIIVKFANQFVDTELVDEEAGTITFATAVKGLPELIRSPGGGVITRDAGIIVFTNTFDLETGELVSSDVEIKGPHPEAESDFALFCEVFTEALA
jgi:hypothetical protein